MPASPPALALLVLAVAGSAGCYLSHELPGGGAPTPERCDRAAGVPMAGYGPDRARRSAFDLPVDPRPQWDVVPGSGVVTTPVVDSRGRMYLTVDRNETDGAVLPNTLVAVDPDGTVVWERDPAEGSRFDGQMAVLAGDELAFFTRRWVGGDGSKELVIVDRRGEELRRFPVRSDTMSDPAVDGPLLVLTAVDPGVSQDLFTIDSRSGATLWTVPLLRQGFAGRPAVGASGTVYVAADPYETPVTELFAVDEGALVWQRRIEGHLRSGPSIAADGSLRLVVASEDNLEQWLVALEPDGAVRHRTAFGHQAYGMQEVAIAADGTTFARAWDVLFAVDPGGAVLWQRPMHPNLAYDVAVDAGGDVLLSSGGFLRLDPASGDERWSIGGTRPTPTGFSFPDTATLVGCGRVVFSVFDGALVSLAD